MRLQTRGPEKGKCNICGVEAKLTEDHIPPKGVPRVGQAYLMELIDLLGAERPRKSHRLFQNGVKFRSLCAKCNNELLGARYDPGLVALAQDVSANFRTRNYLPLSIDVNLNRVARSVVGHLLAHGIDRHRRGEVTDLLTDFFLDESAIFPSDLRLYCWLYPYNDQIIVDGASVLPRFGVGAEPVFFMLIKFFPISFMVTRGPPPPHPHYLLTRLDTLLTRITGDYVQLSIPLSGLPHRRWPEAPGKDGAVMHVQGSTAATRVAP